MAKKYEDYKVRTVEPALLEAWQLMERAHDCKTIAECLGYSTPVITRALKHGNVTLPELSDKISKWFIERAESEKEQAKKLNILSKELKTVGIYGKKSN